VFNKNTLQAFWSVCASYLWQPYFTVQQGGIQFLTNNCYRIVALETIDRPLFL
jgi:hypothetical protein